MLTNTADIELFLDRHYEDIYWVSENILAAEDHEDRGLQGNMHFTWSQFEWFCAQLLRIQGWKIECFDPNVSCDRAACNSPADIIATRNNQRIFVSCKHWATPQTTRARESIFKINKVRNSHQSDNLENLAVIMMTNIFVLDNQVIATNNNVELQNFYKIKKLNLEFLITENSVHKWKSKFSTLIAEKNKLKEDLAQEKLQRENLENDKNNLKSKLENLNQQIRQNRQNQIQDNHQNWQVDQEKFYRINQELERQKHEAEIRIGQIGQELDRLNNHIREQEEALAREKNHNKIGTKINLKLLQEKTRLTKTLALTHQQKQLLEDKFEIGTQEIAEDWYHKVEGERVWFWTSMAVLCLFAMLAFGIVLN